MLVPVLNQSLRSCFENQLSSPTAYGWRRHLEFPLLSPGKRKKTSERREVRVTFLFVSHDSFVHFSPTRFLVNMWLFPFSQTFSFAVTSLLPNFLPVDASFRECVKPILRIRVLTFKGSLTGVHVTLGARVTGQQRQQQSILHRLTFFSWFCISHCEKRANA